MLALILTTFASGLWAALLFVNLQTDAAVPWAVVAMAVLLWAMWQYAGGRWWPRTTSRARGALLRANRVSTRVMTIALVSGGCSLVALTGVWIVLFQTGLMRGNPVPDFSHYPAPTVVAVLGDGIARWSVRRRGRVPRLFSGRAGTPVLCARCNCDCSGRADTQCTE